MNHKLASEALAQARTWQTPFVLYRDPELGGYGAYTKQQLETVGSWCLPYVVLDSDKLGTPWADCLRELEAHHRATDERCLAYTLGTGWEWTHWGYFDLDPNAIVAWDTAKTTEQNARLLIGAVCQLENHTERTADEQHHSEELPF